MSDKGIITIDILPDGRIKIDTGDMSGPHHKDADDLLKTLEYIAGGQVERKKKHGHVHVHVHQKREVTQ